MKVKLKFDLNSIQEFFIRHAEKFVLGAAVLVLIWLAYNSMGREQIDLTPEKLTQAANDAKDMIDRTPAKATRQATSYSEVAKKIRQDIREDKFDLKTLFDPPPFPPARVRPPLPAVTVEALRASAGHGAVMSAMAMGDSRGTQGLRWAVITGLVNLQKQVNEAIETYRDTLPPFDRARDIPEVLWFQVERAEVGAKADLDHLEWSHVDVKKMLRMYDTWRGVGRDVVPENYIYSTKDFSLVLPPPPMGEEHVWGDELAHLPEVPRLVVRDDRLGPHPGFARPGERKKPKPRVTPNAEPTKPAEEGAGADVPDPPPDPNGPEGPNPPGTAAPPAPGGGPMAGPPKMGLPMGGGRKGFAPGGATMPGGMAGGGDPDQLVPWRLFRFFDFTVQPGKRYRYHVQLWWRNPNYGIPGQYLANPDDAKEAYVKTEWSATCEPVEVPRDARILAGEIVKQHLEQCKVGIAYFDLASGSEAFELLDAARGKWLNFYDRTLHTQQEPRHFTAPPGQGPKGPPSSPSLHPKSGSHGSGSHPASSGHRPPPPPPRPSTHHETAPPAATDVAETKVDYITETLLLDVAGGAKILPSRDVNLREPGHVLLLDPRGNLVVLHELTDEEEIKNLGGAHPDVGPTDKKKSKTKSKKGATSDDGSKLLSQPTPPPPGKSSKKSGKSGQ